MKKLYASLMFVFFNALAFAQDGDGKSLDVNITTDKGGDNWYASPLVWVIGAAIFILLLVAILRGGGRKAD